jgi:hypothetical protein
VYISHGFGWAADAWKDKRLQGVDDAELNAIIERHLSPSGAINVYTLVNEAASASHPLHEFFYAEDDKQAAYRWRGSQGQEILRSVVRLWRNTHTNEIQRDTDRAFVSMGMGGKTEHEGVYKLVEVKRPELPAPSAETKKQCQIKRSTQPEPQPQPLRVAAPSPAATNELPEQHKRALGILKKWAESYRDNPYFAPIVAVVDSYPDPD